MNEFNFYNFSAPLHCIFNKKDGSIRFIIIINDEVPLANDISQ